MNLNLSQNTSELNDLEWNLLTDQSVPLTDSRSNNCNSHTHVTAGIVWMANMSRFFGFFQRGMTKESDCFVVSNPP